MERLDPLAAAIQEDHERILTEWRERVRAMPVCRNLDRLTLEDGFRSFLDEISSILLIYPETQTVPERLNCGPVEHGLQRFEIGFDIAQVVIEYSMLRHALRDCAHRHGISLNGTAGYVLHQALDNAITCAVATFAAAQTSRHEGRVHEQVATVVHDLKTPLSAIHTAAHILESRLPQESRNAVSTMLSMIRRNCEHLNTMLMKLLERRAHDEFILHGHMNRAVIHFRHLVDDLIHSLDPLAHKIGVPLQNDVADDLRVLGDPFLLKQLLQNLLSNSLKYTESGHICVGAAPAGDRVKIWVEDTGIGMSSEKVAQLFTDTQTDPLHPDSTGIGLTIVKKIVDAHRGEIEARSAPGEGATFTIFLPA